MANLGTEQVLSVRHWNDTVFSFTTTRSRELRFENGHFVMVGLEVEGKPLTRAYSIASANYEDHLEFFSIKVPDGPLTSRLQHLQPDDELLIGRKSVGTLVLRDLKPGKNLYMLATGTGLPPRLRNMPVSCPPSSLISSQYTLAEFAPVPVTFQRPRNGFCCALVAATAQPSRIAAITK